VLQSLGICSLTHILLINFCICITRCGPANLRSSELMLSSSDLLFFRELMISLISSRFCSSSSGCTVSYIIRSYLSPKLEACVLFSSYLKCSLKRLVMACVPVIRFPSSSDIVQFRPLYRILP